MIKGVDDLEELSLNTSCETLQQHMVEQNMVKKGLKMFVEIKETNDDYKKFYKQFGKSSNLCVHKNQTTIVAHCRRHIEKLNYKQISLKEYMDCMKEDQNSINQRVCLQAKGARRQEAK
eukprot:6421466-Heterocapsa_arctica.AAC.1